MKKIIPDEELITIGRMRKDPFIMAIEEKIAWKKRPRTKYPPSSVLTAITFDLS